ncbi:MAG: o-succinylbenzoate synthase, partial [Candidatus Hydrogenedentes bacterium]|nr:o-succinylbenzoate synthase [Candidatus Hydrogenedentota bacterium]
VHHCMRVADTLSAEGIEAAVLDLLTDAARVPLARLLSEEALEAVPINALLTGSRDEAVAQAAALRGSGYGAAKLKVGGAAPAQHAETVRAVRAALGDAVALRLDANRAWGYDDAVAFGRAVESCGIEYIEEPLDDPSRFVNFASATGIPVALDETVVECGVDDLDRWRGAKAAVLKPTLLGGLEAAMWFARRAANLGMTPVISSSFETGLGLAVLANLAASAMPEGVAAGLGTHSWLGADIVDGPFPVADGRIDVARAHALCRTVAVDYGAQGGHA